MTQSNLYSKVHCKTADTILSTGSIVNGWYRRCTIAWTVTHNSLSIDCYVAYLIQMDSCDVAQCFSVCLHLESILHYWVILRMRSVEAYCSLRRPDPILDHLTLPLFYTIGWSNQICVAHFFYLCSFLFSFHFVAFLITWTIENHYTDYLLISSCLTSLIPVLLCSHIR